VPDTAVQLTLQQSVEDVLEKMFFLQCVSDPEDATSGPEIVAHLTFEGRPSGSLTLSITARAARNVAADFLGAEPSDLSHQQVADVVCELANMICGSALSRIESSTTFRLAAPQIVHPAHGISDREVSGSESHPADSAGGRISVSIQTETSAWSAAARYAF